MKQPSSKIFDRLAASYAGTELQPAEFQLLSQFRSSLHKMDVLDLGVGAGRTTHTFSRLCRSYIGVDYAPGMVEHCKHSFGENERVRFFCADAADLKVLGNRKFDLIVFSYNGADSISREHRLRVFQEVHRLLKPGGAFFFSTHSLDAFPFPFQLPHLSRNPFRALISVGKELYAHLRRAYENRHLDWRTIRSQGWGIVQDGAHDFALLHYYTTVENQIAEMKPLGFAVETVWNSDGKEIKTAKGSAGAWNSFLFYKTKKTARRAA